ncbi:Putative tRNA (cytidine(32)/guanosine(34)-2'-O)-methyltransferase (2'-O-ribose RNA methyltransferase TRM7 homolog) (Protein ftsJ homolog 1) [Durusdinium trenchii]|uniref:tRNA (Cytidine(32)/guanosine(34)-2'-O)-methyltransferase (2'-O-ribose RNA methyltransferase TRM7 homolog) (Protein ftsJ homolog 1) n=1 Tax=Durusdinium trenchii TaxID=1381693 RepID=A0ABP0M653_9DINO
MGHKYEANTWGEHRLRRASDLGEVHLEGGLWAPRRGGRSGWWPAPLEGARPVGQRPLPPPGGYPLEEGLPEPSAPAKMCRWSKVPEAVWDKSQVLANIHSKQALHLDARPVGRFHGEQPEPRPKLRWGHVPGSVSLEAVALLKLPYMLNQKDLQLVVEGAGIKLEHLRGDIGPRILTSCGSGMTACILGLGLHQLGMPLSRWSVYDASWCEWGADQETPIVKRGADGAEEAVPPLTGSSLPATFSGTGPFHLFSFGGSVGRVDWVLSPPAEPHMARGDKRDIYYREAKKEGFRARSAFKLLQIDDELKLLEDKTVRNVADLCAAPGGWSQVLALRLVSDERPPPRIVAVDKYEMQPIAGVVQVQGDITHESTVQQVLQHFEGERADLVVCDGAPDATGRSDFDEYVQHQLLLSELFVAEKLLKEGGVFVAKVFRGEHSGELYARLARDFQEVLCCKPRASRNSSQESFVVCRGYLAKALTVYDASAHEELCDLGPGRPVHQARFVACGGSDSLDAETSPAIGSNGEERQMHRIGEKTWAETCPLILRLVSAKEGAAHGVRALEVTSGPAPDLPDLRRWRILWRFILVPAVAGGTGPLDDDYRREQRERHLCSECFGHVAVSRWRFPPKKKHLAPTEVDAFLFLDDVTLLKAPKAALAHWKHQGWHIKRVALQKGTRYVSAERLTSKFLKFTPPRWMQRYDWLIGYDHDMTINLDKLPQFLQDHQDKPLLMLKWYWRDCNADAFKCMLWEMDDMLTKRPEYVSSSRRNVQQWKELMTSMHDGQRPFRPPHYYESCIIARNLKHKRAQAVKTAFEKTYKMSHDIQRDQFLLPYYLWHESLSQELVAMHLWEMQEGLDFCSVPMKRKRN